MEKWLQDLDVWAWRYKVPPRGYLGAHFTALPSSCKPLLQAVAVLEREGAGSRRTIPLRPLEADDERQISGGMPFVAFSRMQIVMAQPTEELRQYCIGVAGRRLIITLTPEHTADFRSAVESVADGVGDGAIQPTLDPSSGLLLGEQDRSSLQLWYWPCFGHLSATRVPRGAGDADR